MYPLLRTLCSSSQGVAAQGKHSRPDLQAMSRCKKANVVVHNEKQTGELPGIQPGFRFFSRSEMVTEPQVFRDDNDAVGSYWHAHKVDEWHRLHHRRCASRSVTYIEGL